jgi:hypothetical protein
LEHDVRRELIYFPPIELLWSKWTEWNDLANDINPKTKPPRKKPGVYEARLYDDEKRLIIGKAPNLKRRIIRGLIRGTRSHANGKRIRADEDTSKIVVRWACTDRPTAVKKELHKRHLNKFGVLPKYV